MKKWSDISTTAQALIIAVPVVIAGLTYHDQFVTEAEAMETQTKAQAEVRLLRVDGYETEKRTLIREKSKAVELNKIADAERLEQDIQTLRDKIKGLCEHLDEC